MYHKRLYHATTLDLYVQNGTLLIFSLEKKKKTFCMQRTCPVDITNGTLPILKYTWPAQPPFSSSPFLSGCIESGAAPWGGTSQGWPGTGSALTDSLEGSWYGKLWWGLVTLWRDESDPDLSMHSIRMKKRWSWRQGWRQAIAYVWGVYPGEEQPRAQVRGPLRKQSWRPASYGFIGPGTGVQDWAETGLLPHGSWWVGVLGEVGHGHLGPLVPSGSWHSPCRINLIFLQQGTKLFPKGHLGCSQVAVPVPPRVLCSLPGMTHGSGRGSFLLSRSKFPSLGNQDMGYVLSLSAPLLP